MNRRIGLVGCAALAAMLSACTPDEITTEDHTVESIDFTSVDNDTSDGRIAHIETKTEVLAHPVSHIEFMTIDAGEPYTLTVTRNTSTEDKALSVLFGYAAEYTIYVPEDQLKELSRKYAETYQTTLEHTPKDDSDE